MCLGKRRVFFECVPGGIVKLESLCSSNIRQRNNSPK